ncbi:hypothetical protein [uncultured Treponema sp.]|uniref:hypothetical protein n=1 Tax=uncultured Treponema sp. TaxID=162155 RepID=UPI00258E8FDB|nr:hypothetical protein [uncultured Treponema sp.]
MAERKKSVGNEQPLPIDIINDSIIEYLETKDLDKEVLLLKVKAQCHGDNRARKAANAIYSVVTKKSALNKAILNNYTPESYYKLNKADKNTIAISLICLRFPFTFDFVLSLAKIFNVQDTVNKRYINERMASLYGSNLSLVHGIEAALTISINCGFIKREKLGLFSICEPCQKTSFSKEAWISTFFELNGKKSFAISDLRYEPVMTYLSDLNVDWDNAKILHTTEDYNNQIIIDKFI